MKIRRTILKAISLLLIIGLNYSGILGAGETMAYFNDKEIFENNIYSAGTLDFSLFSPHDNFIPYPKVENMKPGDMVSRMIQVRQEGNIPFKYVIRTEKISGDNDFCGALELEAKMEGEIKYPASGGGNSLMDFNFPPVEIADPPGIDTWQFKISLPDDAPDNSQNKTCEFKFVFEGWQDNAQNYEENGFDDTEEIKSNLASSVWTGNWIEVNYPNGGEVWYIGRNYNILWTTGKFDNCNGQLKIDLWYSADSGASWANIEKKDTKNDGSYNWRVPLFLYGETGNIYFTASARARIKAVAICSSDSTIAAWDISDEDFCPPIDYDLLTPEEIEVLESLGLFNDSNSLDFVEDDDILEDFSGASEEFESEDKIGEISEEEERGGEKKDGEISEDVNDNEEIENSELEIDEEKNIEQIENNEIDGEEIKEANNLGDNSEKSEGDNTDESKTEDAGDENNENNGTDAKDEKFVLNPKEEILPEDDDDINNNDNDADDFARESEANSDNDNIAVNSLNKNSVDCVQAAR